MCDGRDYRRRVARRVASIPARAIDSTSAGNQCEKDTNAKEAFAAHMAGANGRGGSSALDGVILRDKDANTSWGSATDGSREERAYYCQNWRGDIVTMLKATGGTSCQVYETVRYSSYGVPFANTPGDIEPDGDVDGDDNTNWPGSYQVRCDYDLDGDMDATDQNFTIANSGRTLGRGVLSHSSVANRKGYCGYEHDAVIDALAHVRHRVLMTELGRWSRRDPLGYVDGGLTLQVYSMSRPVIGIDPTGLSFFYPPFWTPPNNPPPQPPRGPCSQAWLDEPITENCFGTGLTIVDACTTRTIRSPDYDCRSTGGEPGYHIGCSGQTYFVCIKCAKPPSYLCPGRHHTNWHYRGQTCLQAGDTCDLEPENWDIGLP